MSFIFGVAIFAARSSFFTPYFLFAAREFKPCFCLSLFVFVFLGQTIFAELFYPIFFVHRPCIKSRVAELFWELKSHFPSNHYALKSKYLHSICHLRTTGVTGTVVMPLLLRPFTWYEMSKFSKIHRYILDHCLFDAIEIGL